MMLQSTTPTAAGEMAAEEQGEEVDRIEGEELGRDAFLELLVTQLAHQDPLDPMDNREFITQMAQFSELEQMENLNSSMDDFLERQNLAEGANLIGHEVETFDSEADEEITGEVTKVSWEDQEVYLHLEGQEEKYPLSGISSVMSGG